MIGDNLLYLKSTFIAMTRLVFDQIPRVAP